MWSRGWRRVLRDIGVIVVALGAVVGGIAIWFAVHARQLRNDRPLGGVNVDVSRNDRTQSETSIAVDPSSPRVLLGGSNDDLFVTRVYSSTNGGRSWRSVPGPPLASRRHCGDGDPAVAIGPDGRQYYAFLAELTCGVDERPHLFVATRRTARARWRTYAISRPGSRRPFRWDDRPAIAVDSTTSRWRSRVYLVWTRLRLDGVKVLEESHSSNRGRTWSRPVAIGAGTIDPLAPAVTVGANGIVALTVDDVGSGAVWLTRSVDGGRHFASPVRVATTRPTSNRSCDYIGFPVPAQPKRCVDATPTVTVVQRGRRSGDLIVVYGDRKQNGRQGIFAAAFSSRLDHRFTRPLAALDDADQFFPSSAIDPSTGTLWACFYDTTGDSTRKHTWYTCRVSRDAGSTWSDAVRAARRPSDETHYLADINQYGDYEGVAAAGGVGHPIWTDGRNLPDLEEETFSAAIPETRFR